MKKKEPKFCTVCYREFIPYHYCQEYCSKECRREAEKHKKHPAQTLRGRSKPKLTIEEVCRRAKAEGLSYGKYVERHGID